MGIYFLADIEGSKKKISETKCEKEITEREKQKVNSPRSIDWKRHERQKVWPHGVVIG